MRFTVIWSQVAQNQLAELWMNATDQSAVTRASHRIDQLLAIDPDQQGDDFYGDWLLVVPPLQVVYRIVTDDMQVVIDWVW
jgi:hypothetical protein